MITHFHSELINLENGLYQSPENIVVESNTNIIIGIFFLILVSVVLVVVLILTMVHCIRKKRRTSRQSYPTGSLDPASEKLQSKAKEAGEDGWLTQCVPCGPLQNNGKQQAQIVYNTAERRRLKPSSIEETREPDEIDTPASRDEVYRETTMPS